MRDHDVAESEGFRKNQRLTPRLRLISRETEACVLPSMATTIGLPVGVTTHAAAIAQLAAEVAKSEEVVATAEKAVAETRAEVAVENAIRETVESCRNGVDFAVSCAEWTESNLQRLRAARTLSPELASAKLKDADAKLLRAQANVDTAVVFLNCAISLRDRVTAALHEEEARGVPIDEVVAQHFHDGTAEAAHPGDLMTYFAEALQNRDEARCIGETMEGLGVSDLDLRKAVTSFAERLGTPCDKSVLPMIATAGVGGAGKSAFIKSVVRDNDFRIVLPQGKVSKIATWINAAIQGNSAQPNVTHCIVAIATFHQVSAFEFHHRRDREDIEAGVAFRLLWNLRAPTLESLPEHWPPLSICAVAKFFRSKVGIADPRSIAVVLCVDKLMDIDDETMRKKLLNVFANGVQQDARAGLPTIAIVTSLKMSCVEEAWVTASGRKLVPIQLPTISAAYTEALAQWVTRKRSSEFFTELNRSEFLHFARASFDVCSGHPRNIEAQCSSLLVTNANRPSFVTPCMCTTPIQLHTLWGIIVRSIDSPLGTRSYCVVDKECDVLSDLCDKHIIQTILMEGGYVLKPIFAAWLCADPNAWTTAPAGMMLPNQQATSALRTMLFDSSHLERWKDWELGMLAVLYLLASAKGSCCLPQLLPGAIIPNWLCEAVVDVTASTFHQEVTGFKIHELQDSNCAFLYSNNVNEKSIEAASARFATLRGKRIYLQFQNKLRAYLSPRDIIAHIEAMETTNVASHKTTVEHVAHVYFCTGSTCDLRLRVIACLNATVAAKTVIVSQEACKALLQLFGASSMLQAVDGRDKRARE